MIVKLLADPAQGVTIVPPLLNVGVTVIVAVNGEVPVPMAAKDDIFPLPFDAKPMLVLLLVHVYVVAPPVLLVAKVTVAVGEP